VPSDTAPGLGPVRAFLRVAKIADTVEPLALRPREAAKALGICERTLFDLNKAGEIPCVRIGWAILYPVETLRAWLAAKAGAAKPAAEGTDGAGKTP
jgi:excisionase family DNA binding protein